MQVLFWNYHLSIPLQNIDAWRRSGAMAIMPSCCGAPRQEEEVDMKMLDGEAETEGDWETHPVLSAWLRINQSLPLHCTMIVGQGLFYNCLTELKQPDLQKKKLDFDNLTRLLYLSSLSHYSSSVSRKCFNKTDFKCPRVYRSTPVLFSHYAMNFKMA